MERADLTRLVKDTGCTVERHGGIFLFDPQWTAAERTVAETVISRAPADRIEEGWLGLPTGGTSGGVRFARHDERTLNAAAAGFRQHFGLSTVNALDVLPPYHVSGLMARVRCTVTGGQHLAWDWRRLAQGDRPSLPDGDWVVSLVPTQLQVLLKSPDMIPWLRTFRVILLGGGPVWPDLAATAASAHLPIALTYGMTETAAMVTALTPAEFLAGRRDCGVALPHAKVTVEEGVIQIMGESVFRGYWPEFRNRRDFSAEDVGEIDATGHLRVEGRRDAVIITGGKKVQPAEVETVLRATGQFRDIAIVGVPDARWGEAVVACFAGGDPAPDWPRVTAALEQGLATFKHPKRYVAVADWPRNHQGKLNRARLRALAAAA